jgi:hypothetical protein
MSNTESWIKRVENPRVPDSRAKQWQYEKELCVVIDPFIDDQKTNTFTVGQFDLTKEPWRLAAINNAFRKYNLKVLQHVVGDLTEIVLVKKKLRSS